MRHIQCQWEDSRGEGGGDVCRQAEEACLWRRRTGKGEAAHTHPGVGNNWMKVEAPQAHCSSLLLRLRQGHLRPVRDTPYLTQNYLGKRLKMTEEGIQVSGPGTALQSPMLLSPKHPGIQENSWYQSRAYRR